MKDLNDIPGFLKYFRVIKPSEININKDKIFYRDKYNDVINFLKVMLSNHEDNLLNGYLTPKGAILINVNPGTDIVDYIKLIAKNFYLDLIEFNEIEVLNAPDKFLKTFFSILEAFGKDVAKESDVDSIRDNSDKTSDKMILVINQQTGFKYKFKDNNLLEIFLNVVERNRSNFKFVDENLILIWINYDIQNIELVSDKIYETFDLFIKIPLLNKVERETVLKDFLEKNSRIVFDVIDIVNYTENWEVNDINQLLKVGIFKHFLNSELNETSNEITDILIDLIQSGEYLPHSITATSEEKQKLGLNTVSIKDNELSPIQKINIIENSKDISSFVSEIRESHISEFMLNQLYENAASKNYTELILIIDKLSKKEPLEDNDRKILAKYPFLLNDSPNKAQINLEKAKKRVDLIKQAFGK